MTGQLTRRRLIAVLGSGSVVALAGCLGGDDDSDDTGNDADSNGTDDEDNGDDGTADAGDESQDEPDVDPDAAIGPEEVTDGFDATQDGDYDPPTAPDDGDFADLTGHDVVRVETVWRQGADPEFVFDPPYIRVDEGTTIVWLNTDGVFHTVTSTDSLDNRTQSGEFDVQISNEGDTFAWTADETGRQDYYCIPHAGFMFGSVDVV